MSRLKLTDVEWSTFKIKEIFSIENCKCSKVSLLKEGHTPYVGATNKNNGTMTFVESNSRLITKGGCLVFVCDGEGSIGLSFYKAEDFIGSTTVKVGRNNFLNKYNGMFISTIADTVRSKYNFGYKRNEKNLKNETLQLPVDSYGKPHWQFMEDYIKQEQKVQVQKIIDYCESKMLKTAFDLVSLEDVEWKDYKIGELFRFERKPSKGLNHLNSKRDGISYLGATNRNNGVLDFVEEKEDLVYEGNAIAFIRNGEGSMGYSIYKKEPFIATQDISVGYNENLNQHNAMFITTVADRVRGKYNFGYKRNQQRLEAEILQLPADSNGNPHWEYMSKFMQNIEAEKLDKVLAYIYIYIYKLAVSRALRLEKLSEKQWKEFWLEDIVEIKSGIRLTKENQKIGYRPFIGATEYNNGVTAFVENTNSSLDSNVLGVNYNGSVVENFYHPYECIFTDDVKRLSWLEELAQNKYSYLFLKQCILQQKIKYAYGYKFNARRMKRQKIMLPVDKNGKPDYQYMKEYTQIQEIIEQYKILEFYKRKY